MTTETKVEPEAVPLCLNCLEPMDERRDFCEYCGAPISTYFWLDPLKRIYGAGYVYRKIVGGRNRPVVYYTAIIFLMTQLIYLVGQIPGYSYFDRNDELVLMRHDAGTLAFMGATFTVSFILLLRVIVNMRRDFSSVASENIE